MFSRSANLSIFFFGFDVVSIAAAVWIATWMRLNVPFGIRLEEVPWQTTLLAEALLVYVLVFLALSIYTPDRYYSLKEELGLLVAACLMAGLALSGLLYFTVRDTSRLYLVEFYLIHLALAVGWRGVFFWLQRQPGTPGLERTRVMLAGSGEAARLALAKLSDLDHSGLEVVGYISERAEPLSQPDHLPRLGSFEDAPRLVTELNIDNLLIAVPPGEYNSVQALVYNLFDSPCSLWVVPDTYNLLIYGAHVRNLGSLPMISLRALSLTPNQRLFKRLFDRAFASLSILLLSPLLLIVAIAIRLESAGPVLFKQQRAGENGRLFGMYKFRSMVVGAEEQQARINRLDENGNLLHKSPDDPRITRVGRFIRKTSIDELPQLINVLNGEMSLVGPRPEMPWLVAMYEPWQRKRFAVPQGITGWWQVNGRSDKPMHLNTEYDLYYIQNYSLLLDMQIILRTPWVVLRGRGAF